MKAGLSLRARALQLLAQREQSSVELRRKLTRHAAEADRKSRRDAAAVVAAAAADSTDGDEEADDAAVSARVEEVLDWLRAHQLSSDERFVESRVNARWGRFGNLRIRDELSRHGVALDAGLTQRLNDSELQRAQRVWSARFAAPPADAAAQARQYRFLAGRGFSPEVIRRVIRQAVRDTAAPAIGRPAGSPGE